VFDWDEENIGHISSHNVTPQEAEQVLRNNPADGGAQNVDGEERYVDVGWTDAMRLLVVITTARGDLTRVVTAYDPSQAVREFYLRTRGRLP